MDSFEKYLKIINENPLMGYGNSDSAYTDPDKKTQVPDSRYAINITWDDLLPQTQQRIQEWVKQGVQSNDDPEVKLQEIINGFSAPLELY